MCGYTLGRRHWRSKRYMRIFTETKKKKNVKNYSWRRYYTPRKQDMRFHPFLSRLPHTLVHKPYRFRCASLPFLLGMCFTSKRFLITSSLSASNFRRSIFPSGNRTVFIFTVIYEWAHSGFHVVPSRKAWDVFKVFKLSFFHFLYFEAFFFVFFFFKFVVGFS